MPLGTLDRTPPPFFRQGPSALTKLLFFSALAVFLMVADARFRMTEPLRAALATALLPVQRTLLAPVQMLQRGGQYLGGLAAALEGELNGILGWVEQLGEVDVTGVEPMTSVAPMEMKKRADAMTDGGRPADILANAPATQDSYFVVPKVVE